LDAAFSDLDGDSVSRLDNLLGGPNSVARSSGSKQADSMPPQDYPYVSSFFDRHGKRRCFRRAGKTVGQPGEPAFEAAYRAIIEGRPVQKARVERLPTSAVPRSLRAAWGIVTTRTPEWQAMDPETQGRQKKFAEGFLSSPVAEGQKVTWGEIPLDQLERRHVRMIVADRSDTPHGTCSPSSAR
jgi:hypothetical protein